MSTNPSTRRFELGLPLFSGLDLGAIAKAQVQLESQNLDGLTAFVGLLGDASKTRTIRKLSAIWRATERELKTAEADPKEMASMEVEAADRPFADSFQDALSFQSALWASLGASPAYSDPVAQPPGTGEGESKTSGGSPSES